jgi:hypothetical protein
MALVLGVINARLRDLAKSERVPLIDLARRFPWDEQVFVDACHLIDEEGGLPRKAKIVFDFLIEQRLIEEVVARRGLDAVESS